MPHKDPPMTKGNRKLSQWPECHMQTVVPGTCVAPSGSADPVPQASITDLEGNCTLTPFGKYISLSIQEIGMRPLPSCQWFTPEYVCMTIQKPRRSGWRKN